LDQAEKFKHFDKIYFPYNLDFRGRAYPVPPHLSNVGSDLCRGMLRFSESKPLVRAGNVVMLEKQKFGSQLFAGARPAEVAFDDAHPSHQSFLSLPFPPRVNVASSG